MKNIFLILSLLFCCSFFSQDTFFKQVDTIKVTSSGNILNSPWMGGINAAQFSKIDVNNDGVEDLFIFDRTGNQISIYINNGTAFIYDSDYSKKFPPLEHWALLRDFNNDGKKDIFSYVSGGIGVWVNTTVGTEISFNQLTFTNYTTNTQDPYMLSYQFGNQTNLFVSKVDIPDINDIDGDGDLDVLTFGVLGSRLEYHQNFSVENGHGKDSLTFEIKNACWGHFLETGFNTNTCVLFDTCTSNVANPHIPISNNEKHSGSTILSINLNNDTVKDLILGDVSFSNMVALYNDNTGVNANTSFVSQDTLFPSNTVAVDLFIYPAAYYEDIDLDGIKDLLISPNSDNETQNKESVWYYKNFGSNSIPSFNLISKDKFQNEMIEMGKSSYPVFFDYNNDGLLDFFVSNFGRFDLSIPSHYISSISLYENTGTSNSPEFELVTDDFQNISSLNIEKGLYPAFGDLDNDGDFDLLLGDFSGYLHYFENTSSSPASFNLSLTTPQYQDNDGNVIDIGYAAIPTLFDLDNDGDLDLTIGEALGNLNYYENIGSSSSPTFKFSSAEFGNIEVSEWWTNIGFSIPQFFRNQQNELELYVGAESGYVLKYGNIENNLLGTFQLLDTLASVNIGPNAAPSISYLNNDTLPDLILGNERGGLSIFLGTLDNPISITEINNSQLHLFPNPCRNFLEISTEAKFQFEIFNSLGQEVLSGFSYGKIDVSKIKKGIYIIKVENNFNSFMSRFIKL